MDAKGLVRSAYVVGVVGAFVQVAAANWDVSSHVLGIVDTFFTPSHSLLYLGILLTLIAGLLGVRLSRQYGSDAQLRPILTGFRIALSGSVVQLVAGPLDFWWHANFGFDPFLFTPTHSMLIIGLVLGGVGMMVGVLRLLQADGNTALLKVLAVLSLGSVWLDLNFVVLWLTNGQGVAYTFRICPPDAIYARSCSFVNSYATLTHYPALFLDALGGVALILLAKELLRFRGSLTSVAAIVISVNASANLGFTAFMLLFIGVPGSFYFVSPTQSVGADLASIIPFYLAVILPVALLDLLLRNQSGKGTLITSLAAGPLAVYLDGRFSLFSGLWSLQAQSLTISLLPMVLGGLLAGGLRKSLVDVLLASRVRGALSELPAK